MIQQNKIKALIPHFGKAQKNLYSWKELEGLLNLRPFMNTKRFHTIGIDNSQYRWNNPHWTTEDNGWTPSCLKDVLSRTSTYIADCSRANKKINSICAKLENLLNKNTDCHIYFSIDKNLPNFGKHKDISHNLLIVSIGSIHCKVWTDDGVIEQELSNGDYAFIPAQMYHKVTPLTDKRLSLSFPISIANSEHYEEREWLIL